MKSYSDIASSVQSRFSTNQSIKSMQEFLTIIENENPYRFCRNSAAYLKDVFDYFGYYDEVDLTGQPIRRWKIFDGKRYVWGQERAQNEIYSNLCSFADNKINKIILLHGPNGSAKTSMISAIMDAVEIYSQQLEGAVYTFNWIFSDKGEKTTNLGFTNKSISKELQSLAYISPEDITFKLTCNLRDSPLLIIPKTERKQYLEKLFSKNKLPVPSHLLEAELCQKCQEIYNKLQTAYGGDWNKIICHVQVERFYFSKRLRSGLVSIDPQDNKDATSRNLNLEKNYRIPPILALSDICEPHGDLIDANRGMVELSEIFKRHPETNKYLLTTAEWGTINLPNFIVYLDCVIFATANEVNLSMLKLDVDWPSFNGRFAYVKVPYLLQVSKEKNIYKDKIKDLAKHKHVAPHTEYIIALWAVMTRLRRSIRFKLAKNLSAVQKALLYDKQIVPETWKNDDRVSILSELESIVSEYDDIREQIEGTKLKDAGYEGRRGASSREVEQVIKLAVHNKDFKCLTPLSIFNAIDDISKDSSLYDFLRLSDNDNYYDYEKILIQLKRYYVKIVKRDIRNATGLVEEDEYSKLFEKYIINVRAWSQKEKILNPQTQVLENASDSILNNVEGLLEIPFRERENTRKVILGKVANWALNYPGAAIPYQIIFSDIFEVIRNNTILKHTAQIDRIQLGILRHGTEDWNSVLIEDQPIVINALNNLNKLGYSEDCLKEAIVFVLKNIEDPKMLGTASSPIILA